MLVVLRVSVVVVRLLLPRSVVAVVALWLVGGGIYLLLPSLLLPFALTFFFLCVCDFVQIHASPFLLAKFFFFGIFHLEKKSETGKIVRYRLVHTGTSDL